MIDFQKDYQLENDRVLLRPLTKEDFDHFLPFAQNEPELWTYSLVQPNSAEKMRLYIDKALEDRQAKTSYPFTVVDKRTNRYAGCTRFYDIQSQQATLQLGYTWYGKQFQGTGLNKNCKYLLLEFAFDFLEMERVEFRADKDNSRSIQAMKNIGCVVEGILRSNTYKPDGSRRDSIVLSILKKEWTDSVKQQLKEQTR